MTANNAGGLDEGPDFPPASPEFPPLAARVHVEFGAYSQPAPASSINGDHYLIVRLCRDQETLRTSLPDPVISEPFHDAGGIFHHAGAEGLVSGANPQRKSYASYASFSDPDGNGWVFQEVTARLTGHIEEDDESFTPNALNSNRTGVVSRARSPTRLTASISCWRETSRRLS